MKNDSVLFVDCVGHASLVLNEASGSAVKFAGKFQEANARNKNKREYTFDVLDRNVKQLQETIKQRGLFGECDHPCLTDTDVRVLTPQGWRQFSAIREGDTVYSRIAGNMVESRVTRVIDRP